jgi:hypothetical protein
MQVQIIFTATGSSAATGNFAPGDTLRCGQELARHYVEEAQCARYADGAPGPADAANAPAIKTTKRQRGAKEQA